MIGSHNTFSYLPPVNPIYRLFIRYWRTQSKTIKEQYEAGVRMFDIHVTYHNSRWWPACGFVRLKGISFDTIEDICNYMDERYPQALYTITVEDTCNYSTWWMFLREVYAYLAYGKGRTRHPHAWREYLGIQKLYNNDHDLARDYSFADAHKISNDLHDNAQIFHYYKVIGWGVWKWTNILKSHLLKDSGSYKRDLLNWPYSVGDPYKSKDALYIIDGV